MSEAEDLEALLELYEQVETEPPPERRRHARTVAKARIPAVVEGPGRARVGGTVRDLSRSGIGVDVGSGVRAFERGEEVAVTFDVGAGPVRVRCRVANCRPAEVGRLIVGMELLGKAERVARPTAASGGAGADAAHVGEVADRLGAMLRRRS